MACYHPIPARSAEVGPWTLNPELGTADTEIPCGKCLGCRTAWQTQWATRCTHEARLWKHNTFVTLTYDDEHLPGELIPKHLTDLWKRIRKQCYSNDRILTARHASIRYLACGQYGDRTHRPHYHACLFNLDLADKTIYDRDKNLWTSKTLDALWGHGTTKLSPFEPARAGYVAGYATKFGARDYYDTDGVVLQRPFLRASRRPAPGRDWLDRHYQDLQHGYAILDGGRKTPLPRYYLKKLLDRHETRARHEDNKAAPRPQTDRRDPHRRAAAEQIHTQQQQSKTRRAL